MQKADGAASAPRTGYSTPLQAEEAADQSAVPLSQSYFERIVTHLLRQLHQLCQAHAIPAAAV
jgi:hypothetical protein